MAARILVIEDESIVAMDIVSTLQDLGYQAIGPIAYAERAIEMLVKDPVDLVLMDIHLRGKMDGITAAEQIRSQLDIPVVFLTAYADEATVKRARQAQPYGYVLKPFNNRELNSNIEIALYKHQMERKLRQSEERWASLVTSAPNMILLVDRNLKVSFINHLPVFMKDADRNDLFKYFDSEFHQSIHDVIRLTLDFGKPGRYEASASTPDGSKHWYDTQVGPMYENGKITGAMLIATDITERKISETVLAQRLVLEQTIAELSVDFTAYADLGNSITKALKRICELRALGWAALLLKNPDTNRLDVTNEWCTDGINSLQKILAQAKTGLDSEFQQQFQDADLIEISQPAQMEVLGSKGQKIFKQAGIEALIASPLNIGEQVSGVLLFGSKEPHPWGQEDANLLHLLGNLVSGALERQRAEQAERLARQQSEALRNAMTVLTAELDEEVVLDSVLVELGKILPFDLASVFLYQNQTPSMRATSGVEEMSQAAKTIFVPDSQSLDRLLAQRQLFYAPEILPGEEFPGQLRQLHSWVSAPLVSHGQQLGHLVIFSKKPNAFRPTDLNLIQAFADQAAIGIENAQLYASTHQQSITDELTQIWNRRHFFQLAQVEFARSDRYNLPLSAIMIDIDHFKLVNDHYGHAVGDKVLRAVAQRMKQDLRSVDLLARYGGEEFIVLLVQTGPAEAQQVAERLRKGIQVLPLPIGSDGLNVTVSLGISTRSKNCNTLDELLSSSDLALYQAKQNGRNCVEVHIQPD
jgi:diguanylate cyclase (GGDEF)-like protein/PAS domain S-box-containing protein